MSGFKEAVNNIKERYFLFEEFPLTARDKFPKDCLKKAMAVEEDKIEDYAFRLKNKELEGLLLDVVPLKDKDEINRAVKIICLRRSQRIAKLISFLTQYHYDSSAVNILCKEMTLACNETQIKQGSFLWKFGKVNNKIAALEEAILEEGHDMDAVCKKYGISEKSPFAMVGFLTYFGKCDKTAFLINYKRMILLIQTFSVKAVNKMLSNYLNALSLIEYSDEVNMAIADKLGQPYVSADWKPFPTELRDKFAQWSYMYRLKIHCQGQPEKSRILVKYFEQVRTNYEIQEEQVLIMDFGWIILADVKGSSESYLYDKNLFNKEMNAWKNDEYALPAFIKERREILTARQFMLSTDDAPCIKICYEDIHYYYIPEVLDIKMGLEPDMRERNLVR